LSIAKLVGRRGEPNIAEQGKKQLVAIFASFEQYVAMRHWRGCCCCASVVVLMGYYWLQTLLSNRTALGGWTNLDAGRHLLGDLRVAAIVGSLSLHRISALKCVVYSVESHRCLPTIAPRLLLGIGADRRWYSSTSGQQVVSATLAICFGRQLGTQSANVTRSSISSTGQCATHLNDRPTCSESFGMYDEPRRAESVVGLK
jgi:hypothetical protein